MRLTINGQQKEFSERLILLDLVNEYTKNQQTLVIELNDEIIKREEWAEKKLQDGDKIELVSFVGGG